MTTYFFVLLIAVGIGGMIFAVGSLMFSGNEAVEDRLAEFTKNGGRGIAKESPGASVLLNPLEGAPNQLEAFIGKFFNLDKAIFQSGVKINSSQFLWLVAGMASGAALVAFVFSPIKALAPVAAVVAALLPVGFLFWKRKKRMDKFSAQLPAALDLMGQALRAGQSLPAGIQLVGEKMADPLGPEFHKAFEQQNLGVPLTDSLKDMGDRIDNLDLRFFVTAVTLQRQTGGDLAEILDKISGLIRERFQIKGQIQALTGEGRISGIVLLGLPPVLFLVMLRLNYDYVMKLFETEIGQKMLVGAIVMQLLGAFAIKKIIDIKV